MNDPLRDWEVKMLSMYLDAAATPDNTNKFLVIGHILLDHQRIIEAKEAYQKALECDASSEAALSSLVSACEIEGNPEESVTWAIKSIEAGHGIPDSFETELYSQEQMDRIVDAFSDGNKT